ncbi:MAG: glycosyltransferase family A protein [Bacteroidales bacterium]|nr:glycosyltransferase family A protein [Bacteroidales bacterium]MDD4821179.1 glycosyltransferase family A protein [Bacteroidales bacterium]
MESIAIVIPVYNRSQFIQRTFDSILSQTYRPIELILVDNGSTDNSLALCNEFKEKNQSDQLIVKVLEEQKKGANAARNKGLEAVESEYVTFFDSDDELFPEMINTIHQAISKKQADIIAYTYTFYKNEKNEHVRIRCYSNQPRMQIIRGMLATQNFTVKRDVIRTIGGWDESLQRWQDWEVGVRLLLYTENIYWIKYPPLCRAHVHDDTISGRNFSDAHNSLYKAVETVYKNIQAMERPDTKKLLVAVYFRFLLLAGNYAREGRKDLGRYYYNQLIPMIGKEPLFRLFCPLIYRYISMGGRCSWFFAKLFF